MLIYLKSPAFELDSWKHVFYFPHQVLLEKDACDHFICLFLGWPSPYYPLCVSVTKSCPALCDVRYCSPPGSSVHGILQARALGWVVIPPPGDLPNPGLEPTSLGAPALAGGLFTIESPKGSQRKKSTVNQFSFSANLIIGLKECFGFHSLWIRNASWKKTSSHLPSDT